MFRVREFPAERTTAMTDNPSPFVLPENVAALLTSPTYAHLATIQPDGAPQITMVWIDWDGSHIIVNTVEGYRKLENMRRDPRVALDVPVPGKPFLAVSISGHMVSETTDGAAQHLRTLCMRYLGTEQYPYGTPGQQRVMVRIAPDRLIGFAHQMLDQA
ncbi:MAG: PPOX class F420-dependent oxidoreductase, partial [Thermomicrobiales bacterium]